MKIKDLQKEEKPREKLIEKEAENLTDIELLAIILRSGERNYSATELARDLLNTFGGIKGLLSADIEGLKNFKGIGTAKATSIKALEEISKRYLEPIKKPETYIKSPKDAYEIIRKDIINKNQEYLYLLSIDSRNKLISKDVISKGTVNETLIHPREIFRKAISKNACGIILIHNHPSNKCNPSDEDIKVTRRIYKAGIDIGIPLIDHLIVTDNDFTSMKAQSLFKG
jgi:DNA repair protein RadC